MSNALLTIIVPTYNRAAYLAVLLAALRSELRGLESFVEVLVSDNASTDSTPGVTAAAARVWPALTIQRHERNLGSDGNFLSCIPKVSTCYFWIIGDDDLPKRGVLAKVIDLLRTRKPALMYMQSEWMSEVCSPDQGERISKLDMHELDALAFAEEVNTWITFISGMVINRESLMLALNGQSIERYNNTWLVQLGWILPLFTTTGPFIYIKNKCILASAGNTGGYKVINVFGNHFAKIINGFFGVKNTIAQAIMRKHIGSYMPRLIWTLRFSSVGRFDSENSWWSLRYELGRYWKYWVILTPLYFMPKKIAKLFLAVSKLTR